MIFVNSWYPRGKCPASLHVLSAAPSLSPDDKWQKREAGKFREIAQISGDRPWLERPASLADVAEGAGGRA